MQTFAAFLQRPAQLVFRADDHLLDVVPCAEQDVLGGVQGLRAGLHQVLSVTQDEGHLAAACGDVFFCGFDDRCRIHGRDSWDESGSNAGRSWTVDARATDVRGRSQQAEHKARPANAYSKSGRPSLDLRDRPLQSPSFPPQEKRMARYGKTAATKVKKALEERKKGTLKSGRSGKTVRSRKQAIAIGLSEARRAGGKVPKKKAPARNSPARKAGRKATSETSSARKSPRASAAKRAGRKSATARKATKTRGRAKTKRAARK